jgi:hypothetical protein
VIHLWTPLDGRREHPAEERLSALAAKAVPEEASGVRLVTSIGASLGQEPADYDYQFLRAVAA